MKNEEEEKEEEVELLALRDVLLSADLGQSDNIISTPYALQAAIAQLSTICSHQVFDKLAEVLSAPVKAAINEAKDIPADIDTLVQTWDSAPTAAHKRVSELQTIGTSFNGSPIAYSASNSNNLTNSYVKVLPENCALVAMAKQCKLLSSRYVYVYVYVCI